MSRKKFPLPKRFDATFSVALPVRHIQILDRLCNRCGMPRANILRALIHTCLRYHEFNHKYHNPPPPEYFRLLAYIEGNKGGGGPVRRTRTVAFWIQSDAKNKFKELCELAGVEEYTTVFKAIVQLFIEELENGRSITEAMYICAIAFDYWLHYHR